MKAEESREDARGRRSGREQGLRVGKPSGLRHTFPEAEAATVRRATVTYALRIAFLAPNAAPAIPLGGATAAATITSLFRARSEARRFVQDGLRQVIRGIGLDIGSRIGMPV